MTQTVSERQVTALRIMDVQIAQGWTTATTEMLSRRFFDVRGVMELYADFLNEKAKDEDAAYAPVTAEPDGAPLDPSGAILRAQIHCGWSETTLDLAAQEFMRANGMLPDYAEFLEAQALDENDMAGSANTSWDECCGDDDPDGPW